MANFQLFPTPKRISVYETIYQLPVTALILLDEHSMAAAQRFQQALWQQVQLRWERTLSATIPPELIGLRILLAPDLAPQPQGYRLTVRQEGITIWAHDSAGAFYGVATLIQLIEQLGRDLPYLDVQDWPDFAARGVMLDISRDKVPTMETLFALVDRLASWKINQLQLYTEHTFAYRNHPIVWQKASPMTGEEILILDAYCRERMIELVPNQNSFGHMQRWLKHAPYAHLAETQDEFRVPWGKMQGPFSLAPVNPGSLELISGLYDELLPHFSSRLFNVGCDETFDLGQGQSQDACARRGVGRVYLEYLLKVYGEVVRRGFRMQFWGDIVTQYPDLVAALPRDAIALLWGYEAEHPFREQAQQFAAAGVPFYVCPGTSSWCSLAGRTDNALGNLRAAALAGLEFGALGYLNTDWGDYGHWQVLPVSFLGWVAGAAYAWNAAAAESANWPSLVSQFAFDDRSGSMGQVMYDLGNVYQLSGQALHNSSALFWLLRWPAERILERGGLSKEALVACRAAVERACLPLLSERMTRSDAELIRREVALTARMLSHACRRGEMLLGAQNMQRELREDLRQIVEEYRTVWLLRNRPGGLADSLAGFEELLAEYQALA